MWSTCFSCTLILRDMIVPAQFLRNQAFSGEPTKGKIASRPTRMGIGNLPLVAFDRVHPSPVPSRVGGKSG